MSRRVVIDPITRIEGHAKISIFMDDSGQVENARFHVTEFRGFEKFCEGRPFWEMPGICGRVCGICPVSHMLASSKAGDAILAVKIPPPAVKLRRLMNLGQILQSHALSFFHLSGPDLLLGWDCPPEKRHLYGMAADHPEMARAGIRLRQFGQEVIESLGGRKIHPTWSVPGGVRDSLTIASRDHLRGKLVESYQTMQQALDFLKNFLDQHTEEVATFGLFHSLFLGLVTPEGNWETYDGLLRIVDAQGSILAETDDMNQYSQWIGEAVERDSYLKSPYFKPSGYPQGIYRVGPLARLNLCEQIGTPRADAELREYRQRAGPIALSSFHYHYARLVEMLACVEGLERLLDDAELHSDHLRARAGVNRYEGVGVSEAPRGILFHHYQVDPNGLIQKVNLVIATGQNNLAMNQTITQIAKHYIRDRQIPEPFINRVEAGIRAFDPCLSCSTHAYGQMPLRLELRDWAGNLLDWKERNSP